MAILQYQDLERHFYFMVPPHTRLALSALGLNSTSLLYFLFMETLFSSPYTFICKHSSLRWPHHYDWLPVMSSLGRGYFKANLFASWILHWRNGCSFPSWFLMTLKYFNSCHFCWVAILYCHQTPQMKAITDLDIKSCHSCNSEWKQKNKNT